MTWGPAVVGGGTFAGQAGIVDAVDVPSAVEFMREALVKISEDDIGRVADLLARKREDLAPLLAEGSLAAADAEAVRPILARVFATRRRSDDLLVAVGAPAMARAISALVHGPGRIESRFAAFDLALAGIEAPVRRDLAGECLHFSDPARYWLWSRWMWDPATGTGALPLVMVDDFDLTGEDPGAVYLRVGAATSAVIATARDLGFQRMGASPFAVDVYLAAIYGIYMYTVTRLRMTQEFNRVIPQLPELVRRLLGVWTPEPARGG
ncbi:MAG: hypothetical protein OEV61_03285 [Chloroflexota bacterium]|jgi:hypothetical protein|nr:hypothetical protein [Chloroflexota bacterium]MDH5243450.1 hypothetical protein [Chloroflexota bacterium]